MVRKAKFKFLTLLPHRFEEGKFPSAAKSFALQKKFPRFSRFFPGTIKCPLSEMSLAQSESKGRRRYHKTTLFTAPIFITGVKCFCYGVNSNAAAALFSNEIRLSGGKCRVMDKNNGNGFLVSGPKGILMIPGEI